MKHDRLSGCYFVFCNKRRKFIDAEKVCGSNEFFTEVIKLIGNLYAVEKYIRENNLDNKQSLEIRNKKPRPLLEKTFLMVTIQLYL